jgi:hypothetical protein
MSNDTAKNTLLGINFGIGFLFLLFPKLAMRLFGIDPEQGEPGAYATRYLGARSILLGALLAGEPEGRRALLKLFPLIAATDATANVLAGATGEVPKRSVVMGAITSAVAVAAGMSIDE